MNSSHVAKTVAAAAIAVGISAFAAPAALADGYVTNNQDGDNTNQHVSGFGNTGVQIAENEIEVEADFGGKHKPGHHHGKTVADHVAGKLQGR
ncbi:hypothetical protein [Parasphingorhabdus pacifica]